jgi:peptide/nickel transport system permease protein
MSHHLPARTTRRLWLLPVLGAAALGAALWQPWPPEAIDLSARHFGPSLAHPLGADQLGRDLLSRLLVGFGRTLAVVAIVAACWAGIGTLVGVAAACARGFAAAALLRLAEFFAVLPSLLAAIVLTALFGLDWAGTGLALGLAGWGPFALLSYGLARRGLSEPYVFAARALGGSTAGLVRRHVLPAMRDTQISYLGTKLGRVAIAYAALAFLGLGADPGRADWGAMMFEYRLFAFDRPLLLLAPGFALIALCVALRFAIGGDDGERVPASSGDVPAAVDHEVAEAARATRLAAAE